MVTICTFLYVLRVDMYVHLCIPWRGAGLNLSKH